MQAIMDAVPLKTWREVVRSAVSDAKTGDHQARSWLARYLVGEPKTIAPAPIQVVVEQLLQSDPALERAAARLAKPGLDRVKHPTLRGKDELDRADEAEAAAAIRSTESAGA